MTTQTAELLRQGIAAAKSGLRSQARELLMQVVDLDDHNEAAWLWLSGVVDDPSDQLVCLENVLIINPDNLAAARGLQHLRQQHPHLDQPAAPSPESAKLGELSMDWAGAVGFEQVGPLEEEEAFWQQEMATPVPAAPPPPPVAVPKERAHDTIICVHCGTVNPGWRDLCVLCGKPATGSEIKEPAESVPHPLTPAGPVPAAQESDEVRFVDDYDTRPQGLLTLGAAWIAAIMLNRRGAYEQEVFSASFGRTVASIVIGGIAIPFLVLLLVGILITASAADTLSMIASLVATPVALVCWGIPAAVAVVTQFYIWAAALYLVAWLVGGKASFTVHAQLLSIAYSAVSLLGSLGGILAGAAFAVLAESAPDLVLTLLSPAGIIGLLVFGLLAGLYSLAIQGQALATAHRFSWLGGMGLVLLSGLLYGLLLVLLMLLIMLLGGFSLADLQTLVATQSIPIGML